LIKTRKHSLTDVEASIYLVSPEPGQGNQSSTAYGQGMRLLQGFVRAAHPLPTIAVSLVITAFAWSLGWTGWPLVTVFAAILIGQLSVGWSNDAFDASLDARVGRTSKPTVALNVSARALWIAAACALLIAILLSWAVAGWLGGSFHVFAILMAWLYNIRLSRTVWSWLPYALAFGVMPAFLSFGFSDEPPTVWAVAVFAIIGVSAHLANALPDADSDAGAGVGGLVVRLGIRRSVLLCWLLLALGSGVLVVVSFSASIWLALIIAGAFVSAVILGSRWNHRAGMFHVLIAMVGVDVAALVFVTAIG
jgi:4-hydroxybenzoate polyprenyltransferase